METTLPLNMIKEFNEDNLEKFSTNGFTSSFTLKVVDENALNHVFRGQYGLMATILFAFAEPPKKGASLTKK